MAVLIAPLLAEFSAYLERTRLEQRLQLAHLVIVGLGLLLCLGVLALHFALPAGGGHASLVARNLLLLASLLNLFLCTWMIGRAQDAALRRLQARSEHIDQRVAQLIAHILQRDGMLLVMAIVGQGLAAFAAVLKVRMLSVDAPLVVLNLLPTVQLAVIAGQEIPTRARLMYLYKLVALHNERARRHAEQAATALADPAGRGSAGDG